MARPKYNSKEFFEIRINSVLTGIPLTFDVYLWVNDKATLFRRKGEVLTPERVKLLGFHGGEVFLVPEGERKIYMDSLQYMLKNPSSTTEVKAKFIKESAFVHVQDLFTREDISSVVTDAKGLVDEMVQFVSADVEAVTSLMGLSVHDYYTYNHSVDVAVYSIVLAKRLFGDDKDLLLKAGLGGLLHDVGKRKIDQAIINKKGALLPEEWTEIKMHPVYGRDYLAEIATVPDESKLVVFEHHENYDGTGYPMKLEGENIHKLARVVTIADVFDALTTNRSYHKAASPTEALNTMFGMQPGKFDPAIFRSFNKNFSARSPFELAKDFDPCQPGNEKKVLRRK